MQTGRAYVGAAIPAHKEEERSAGGVEAPRELLAGGARSGRTAEVLTPPSTTSSSSPPRNLSLSPETFDGPMKAGRAKKKKRNRLEIISEMLALAENGSRKTNIMYRANLSYDLLVHYMSVLRGNELLETSDGTIFFLTRKGRRFLKEFRELTELQDSCAQKALLIDKMLNRRR